MALSPDDITTTVHPVLDVAIKQIKASRNLIGKKS